MKISHTLLVVLLLFSVASRAQNRPRVGLALSGGGAKSMAQLGALRVIEQSGIKIDYISGTSMGAVIGAMYAMGYTVDEIEYWLAQVDWDQLMTNEIPKNRLPYLNREDEKYLLNINLEDGELSLPNAINQGNYILKILDYLSMRHHDVNDFSQFDIPFLCMATDLETGESVVFEQGEIASALRASVAFPSLFAPFEIDGRLYVDGGVRNNLPIAVLKDQKQMDIVIAIDVQGQLYNKEDINSIVDVLEQVGSFPNMLYFEEQKKKADFIIRPPIDNYGITDYAATDTLVKSGYAATLVYLDEFKSIANRQGQIANYPRPCCKATPLVKFQVDSVLVTGVSPSEATLVRGKLHIKKPGEYELSTLDRGLDLLYGSKKYKKVDFQFSQKDSANIVKININKKPTRHSFGFGVHYDDDFSIALLANYTMRDALILNSIFKVDLAISENPRGSISWIFERGYVPSLGIKGSFNRFQPRIYSDGVAETQLTYFTYNAEAFLHSTIANKYTIGTGIKWDNVELSEVIPIINITRELNQYLIYYGFLDFYSLNRSFKPTSGFDFNADFNAITDLKENAVEELRAVGKVTFNTAFSLTSKLGANAAVNGAFTIGPDLDYPYNIFVGGLGQNYINFTFPFVGYRHMELIGRDFAAIKASLFYEFAANHFVTICANAGKLESSLDALFDSNLILDGYGVSYGYNSPIGPLELTVMGSSNHAKIFTYISLGFWF